MKGPKIKVCAVTDEAVLKNLSRKAEVMCARCGAKSHNKTNVCEPVALEPDH